jgi:anaerobic ribonucleoside-triphosphate reductase
MEKNLCHDCQKEIKIGEDGQITNGVQLAYNNGGEKINVLKCNECYEKNKSLNNYQNCEVYSRVVGYLRPVQQWHEAKSEEFNQRKEFKMPKF